MATASGGHRGPGCISSVPSLNRCGSSASIIHIKAGAKRDGTLTAWEARVEIATGAYAAYTLVPADGGILVTGVAGPYRTPNVFIDSYQVYTHTIACGYARAPGPLQCAFACESHMDVIAAELGISPVAIRERNMIRSGDEVVISGAWHPEPGPDDAPAQNVRLAETLRQALDAGHFDAPKPPNVGRGIAITVAADYTGDGHASVSIGEDGVITMGMPDYGPGMDSYTMSPRSSQELGVVSKASWRRPGQARRARPTPVSVAIAARA